jgi:Bacteriophage baseplate protein W
MSPRPNPNLPKPALGWPLLPVPAADGTLAWPDLESSIRQTIRVILMTRPGELILEPRFGAGLPDYLHQPNEMITRRRIQDAIARELGAWEPRIHLDAIEVEPDPERGERLSIRILYRIPRTGAAGSVGLSMTLQG